MKQYIIIIFLLCLIQIGYSNTTTDLPTSTNTIESTNDNNELNNIFESQSNDTNDTEEEVRNAVSVPIKDEEIKDLSEENTASTTTVDSPTTTSAIESTTMANAVENITTNTPEKTTTIITENTTTIATTITTTTTTIKPTEKPTTKATTKITTTKVTIPTSSINNNKKPSSSEPVTDNIDTSDSSSKDTVNIIDKIDENSKNDISSNMNSQSDKNEQNINTPIKNNSAVIANDSATSVDNSDESSSSTQINGEILNTIPDADKAQNPTTLGGNTSSSTLDGVSQTENSEDNKDMNTLKLILKVTGGVTIAGVLIAGLIIGKKRIGHNSSNDDEELNFNNMGMIDTKNNNNNNNLNFGTINSMNSNHTNGLELKGITVDIDNNSIYGNELNQNNNYNNFDDSYSCNPTNNNNNSYNEFENSFGCAKPNTPPLVNTNMTSQYNDSLDTPGPIQNIVNKVDIQLPVYTMDENTPVESKLESKVFNTWETEDKQETSIEMKDTKCIDNAKQEYNTIVPEMGEMIIEHTSCPSFTSSMFEAMEELEDLKEVEEEPQRLESAQQTQQQQPSNIKTIVPEIQYATVEIQEDFDFPESPISSLGDRETSFQSRCTESALFNPNRLLVDINRSSIDSISTSITLDPEENTSPNTSLKDISKDISETYRKALRATFIESNNENFSTLNSECSILHKLRK